MGVARRGLSLVPWATLEASAQSFGAGGEASSPQERDPNDRHCPGEVVALKDEPDGLERNGFNGLRGKLCPLADEVLPLARRELPFWLSSLLRLILSEALIHFASASIASWNFSRNKSILSLRRDLRLDFNPPFPSMFYVYIFSFHEFFALITVDVFIALCIHADKIFTHHAAEWTSSRSALNTFLYTFLEVHVIILANIYLNKL